MILKLTIRPGDTEDDIRDKQLFVPMLAAAVGLSVVVASIQYYVINSGSAIIPLVLAGVFFINLLLLIATGSIALCHNIAFLALLTLPALDQWALGGFVATGGLAIWGMGGPFGGMIFRSLPEAMIQFVLYLIVFAVAILAEQWYPSPFAGVPKEASVFLLIGNLAAFMGYIMVNVMHFRMQRDEAQNALREQHSLLQEEKHRSENLLLNVLPARIADRLKAEPGPIAEGFDDVCIIFADIANFTPLASKMEPTRLVGILNEIFSRFDDIAEQYGLEKIKTLGDAYMAAAGLPEKVDRPAQRCAEAALAMQSTLRTIHIPEAPDIQLRIGIHSGPVVAGVIGRKKFIYDLWGDAVNTASRMESHGNAGHIHISAEASRLLDDEFVLQARGQIDIKGKGLMPTYFLLSKK
ncbi:MAG: adenylate/guanylate cyclase domain-containing protein [Leptospiraceae bacterium]